MILRWILCFFVISVLAAADKTDIKNLELSILNGVKNGAGYVSIYNGNVFTISLYKVIVQPEVFHHIEIHDHVHRKDENGLEYVEMIEIPEVDIPPGATVFLQRGRKHLMLIDIQPSFCHHKKVKIEFFFRSSPGEFSKTMEKAIQYNRCKK